MIVRNIMRVNILATLCVWRYVPGIRHGVTDIRHVATGMRRDPLPIRKDSTHDAVRHGCYLACHARALHVFLLFPLHCADGLGREVVTDAADAGNLGGHDVDGVDAADDARPVVGALALAHAGGAEVGHDSKVLPDSQSRLVNE